MIMDWLSGGQSEYHWWRLFWVNKPGTGSARPSTMFHTYEVKWTSPVKWRAFLVVRRVLADCGQYLVPPLLTSGLNRCQSFLFRIVDFACLNTDVQCWCLTTARRRGALTFVRQTWPVTASNWVGNTCVIDSNSMPVVLERFVQRRWSSKKAHHPADFCSQ